MSRGGRSTAYAQAEVNVLLDIVAEILPLGSDQWERVGTEFRSRFPTSQRPRDNDSLKLKFKSLRLVRKPTGDPTCPPEVRRAKLIYREIERNSDVVGAAESEDEELAILDDNDNGNQDGNYLENFLGDEIRAEASSATAPVTPAAALSANPAPPFSLRSASPMSSGNSVNSGRKTTLRTGYTERELINMTSGSKTKKLRTQIDEAIAATAGVDSGLSFQQMMLLEQRREDRREEERLRREEERELREAKQRERDEAREDRREQQMREDRNMQMQFMAALFGRGNGNNA